MKPLAVMTIATGLAWLKYARNLIQSLAAEFPPHEVILFSENPEPGTVHVEHMDLGWPRATLMRYHAFLRQADLLSQYEQVVYMDADMLVVAPVTMDELCTDAILPVIHPCYPPNSFERRRESTAFVEGNPIYYQACLVVGATHPFLDMCHTIAHNVDADDNHGIVACNYDESHYNRYLVDHPPSRALSPTFAFPGQLPEDVYAERNNNMYPQMRGLKPRIRHVYKADMEGRVW